MDLWSEHSIFGIQEKLFLTDRNYAKFLCSGAGCSEGTASWTSKPELSDYISFVGLFIHYINGISPHNSIESSPVLQDTGALTPIPSARAIPPSPIGANAMLVLGGYSYGSLLTSHLPTTDVILKRFTDITKGSVEAEIRIRAQALSGQWNKEDHNQYGARRGQNLRTHHKHGNSPRNPAISFGGGEVDLGSQRSSRESKRSSDVIRRSADLSRKKILGARSIEAEVENEEHIDFEKIAEPDTYYLLISPLLPPISLLATMFSKFGSHSASRDNALSSHQNRQKSSQMDEQLASHSTLAIYGDSDFFTSKKKLRKWAESLAERPNSRFRFREIGGAGHFWQEEGVARRMRGCIREWLQPTVSCDDV